MWIHTAQRQQGCVRFSQCEETAMKQKILGGTLVLFGTIMAACGGYSGGYYVRTGPPAPRYEVVGVGRPGYVWTNGYWDWRGNNWSWAGGRWVRPPRHGA